MRACQTDRQSAPPNFSFWPNPAASLTDSSGSYWGKTGHACHWLSRQFLTRCGSRVADFAVMHNTAQTAKMRSVEPGQGNETALQSRPRTS